MNLVFDSPQWALRRDAGEKTYGGVSNRVEVSTFPDIKISDSPDNTWHTHIVVPTEFFPFAEEILGIGQDDVGEVYFYLDILHEGPSVFGVGVGDSHMDLWAYKSAPGWALNG